MAVKFICDMCGYESNDTDFSPHEGWDDFDTATIQAIFEGKVVTSVLCIFSNSEEITCYDKYIKEHNLIKSNITYLYYKKGEEPDAA